MKTVAFYLRSCPNVSLCRKVNGFVSDTNLLATFDMGSWEASQSDIWIMSSMLTCLVKSYQGESNLKIL